MPAKKIFLSLRDGFVRTKLALSALCVLCYLLCVRLSGGSLIELFWLCFCVAVYLYFPGKLFARLTGMEKALPGFAVPLAILFGTGFFAALYCVCMRLGALWLLRALPPLLALAGAALCTDARAALSRARSALRSGGFACLLLLWSVLSLLFGLFVSVKNAHPVLAGAVSYNQDLLWNIGNANSFAIAFPPQDIRFSQVRLSYHYLTEMTEGALSIVSGLSAYNVIAFYMGPVVLAALLAVLYAFGVQFYHGSRNKALAMIASLFLCGCASTVGVFATGVSVFGNTNLQHLVSNINSQASALIFISIFVALLMDLAKRKFRVRPLEIVVFWCSFVLVCFSKGPAAAIVACSFSVTMLFVLLQKPAYGKALAALGGVAAIFAVIYLAVFSAGANNSTYLNYQTIWDSRAWEWLAPLREVLPLPQVVFAVAAVLVNIFCWQPFQLPLFCRGLWGDVRSILHLPAERLLANGAVAGGFLAYHLFWHPNSSQVYFALIAVFFLNLLAVDRLDKIRSKAFRAAVLALGAVGLATTVCTMIVIGGSGVRQLARNLGVAPPVQAASYATAGDEQAMQWLHENTGAQAQFATNRIHSTADPARADGISNVYSALSGRQAYMEGYSYALTNMGVSQAVLNEKKAVNHALFSADTSPQEIVRLCKEHGITHLVYSAQYPGDTTQLSALVQAYRNADVTIYAVDKGN